MASEKLGTDDSREKQRWGENSKVYTRKFHNKRLKHTANDAVSTAGDAGSTVAVAVDAVQSDKVKTNGYKGDSGKENIIGNCDKDDVILSSQALGVGDGNSLPQEPQFGNNLSELDGVSGNLDIPSGAEEVVEVENGNGVSHNLGVPSRAEELENGNGVSDNLGIPTRAEVMEMENGSGENWQEEVMEVENENGDNQPEVVEVEDGNGVSDNLESPNQPEEMMEVENGNGENWPEVVEIENENGVSDDLDSPKRPEEAIEVEHGNGEQRPAEVVVVVENGNGEQRPAEVVEVENGNGEQQPAEVVEVEKGNGEHHPAEVVEVENRNVVIEHPPAEVVEAENGNVVTEHGAEEVAEEENGNDGIEHGPKEVVEVDNRNEVIVHQPAEVMEVENGNGVTKPIVTRVDDRVRINLETINLANSKDEIQKLRERLVSELDQVRGLVKDLEAKEVELHSVYSNTAAVPVTAYGQSQHSESDVIERRTLTRVHSEVGSVVHLESRPFHCTSVPLIGINDSGNNHLDPRPFHPVSIPVTGNNDLGNRRVLLRVNSEAGSMMGSQDRRSLLRVNSEVGRHDYRPFQHLSVSVMENNNHIYGAGEFIEKEKRTPKANQFYRNSEFLLGKDRLPPESNRKAKSSGGRKHGGSMGYGFGMDRHMNKVFKNCSNLLQRLMKHKHGWVFNEPVNAKMLGLHDYHDIIKYPMDLGTIKSNLAQNLYKSPLDFAEDVRLTFRNAMTYNPKGQDVHVMAEQMLDIFEEKWAGIEAEYNSDWRYEAVHYAGTPTSRKGPPPFPLLSMRTLDRSESITAPVYSRPKSSIVPVSRTPVPKKPKAKDLNKRDMTYDEKQKLSTNLQAIPPEKLDCIVQIMRKRNSTLSQNDNEIEVDIDSVDVETLWDLDRFVTNYKKSLSKNKRKAELARAKANATYNVPAPNTAASVMVPFKENERAGENDVGGAGHVQTDKQHETVSRSSSSSSSSSDSGSSSSDSDSDSSSAYGSDAPRS